MEFAVAFPEIAVASPTLVLLAARDELDLSWLAADASAAGLHVASSHEPDLADSLTAVALESAGQRLVTALPLALAGALSSSGEGR